MDSLQTISNDLVQSITEKEKKKSIPYDTYAKVIRIDGGTAWVHIPGGVDETPVALTVNAKVGDSVLVRVSGGNAWIVGNSSAPPTDDTKAVEAKGVADVAQVKAASAQETAESAEEIAKDASRAVKSTNQYFWHTETDTGAGAGAHITKVPQEDFLNDPANGGGNLLAQSGGIAIRDGLTDLATFGANGAQIGQNANGLSRTEIGTEGMQIYQKVSGVDTIIANLGYGPGTTSGGGTSTAPFYTFGSRAGNVGNYSIAEGINTEARGYASHAEGAHTKATGAYSHAEGRGTTASINDSHAEGYQTTASNSACHAEGYQTTASGNYSHAEGHGTTASSPASHAEGSGTTASGAANHAEGSETTASGNYSHAQNQGTIADQNWQTAIGRWNTTGNSDNLFVIGNGTSSNRADAFQVNTLGNVEAAGTITSGNHATPIGHTTERKTGTYSLATGTTFVTVPESDLPRITLPEGTWIIQAHAAFESNDSGRRSMRIYSATGSTALSRSFINQMATSGAATNMNTMAIVDVGSTDKTYTVQLAQNSGSAKSVSLVLEAVRIA